MTPELSLIEGFYGTPYPASDRLRLISVLAENGFRSFLYAPKADAFLRRRWREPHPPSAAHQLRELSVGCAAASCRFGVGLTPFGVPEDGLASRDRQALSENSGSSTMSTSTTWRSCSTTSSAAVSGRPSSRAEIVHRGPSRARRSRVRRRPTLWDNHPVNDDASMSQFLRCRAA